MTDVIEIAKKGFDWIRDGEFWKLFLLIWASYLAIYLAVIVFGVIYAFTNSLLVIIPAAIVVIPLLLLAFYLSSLHLYSKALEKYGEKTKYTEISLPGIIDMVVFNIVSNVTYFFNWVDKRILIAQVALTIIGIVFIAAAFVGYSSQNILLAIAAGGIALLVLIAYGAVIIYNSLRYVFDTAVRVVEADGARDAMVKAWPKTQGRVLEVLGLAIVLGLIGLAFGIAGAVITVPLSVIGELVPAISIVTSFFEQLVSTFINVFIVFVSVFAISNYYLAVRRELAAAAPKKAMNGGNRKSGSRKSK